MENGKKYNAERLKLLRQQFGLTTRQISEKTGIALSSYQKIESGTLWITFTTAKLFAKLYNVSIDLVCDRDQWKDVFRNNRLLIHSTLEEIKPIRGAFVPMKTILEEQTGFSRPKEIIDNDKLHSLFQEIDRLFSSGIVDVRHRQEMQDMMEIVEELRLPVRRNRAIEENVESYWETNQYMSDNELEKRA